MSNKVALFLITIIAVVGAILIYYFVDGKEEINSDALRFSNEYTLVDKNNIFVYKNIDEIINILESETGIVYLGFPECPWCQRYVKYLNEVALNSNIKEIYYYNILQDRNNNTDKYQKIVSLLSDNLINDDNGMKRVFVPDVSFVKNGKVLYHDNETSIVDSDITPEEYWNEQHIINFKSKIQGYIDNYTGTCTSCN